MTEDIKLEDKTQGDDEINYKEIGIDTVSDDVYKYTNKGKVHEFDLRLLTKEERNKFDKMSNKEKQRLIATVELQQMPSMFDEISLKSVVYPDPDSNIADIQAAAAKYNELQTLVDTDPTFKQMELAYLKYSDVQKYILNHCPSISQYDIDLLLKLKPDMTVNQFMNYFKNIMNDKNLVEMNKIQKQLKNPYSDDLLKRILNDNQKYDAGLLSLIVNNDFNKLRKIDDDIRKVLDDNLATTEDMNKYLGVRKNILGKMNLTPLEEKTLKRARKLYNRIETDINETCKTLAKSLNLIGMKITKEELIKNVIYNKKAYDELQHLINETMWDEIISRYPIGKDVNNPRWKLIEKNRLADIDKDELNEEMKRDTEKAQRKKKEIKDNYLNKIKSRDDQNEEVIPTDSVDNENVEISPNSFNKPSNEHKTEEPPIINSLPQESSYENESVDDTTPNDKISRYTNELNTLVFNRHQELYNEYSRGMTLKPGNSIELFDDTTQRTIPLFSKYSNNKFYSYSVNESRPKIIDSLMSGHKLTILEINNNTKGMTNKGRFDSSEMINVAKKLKDLRGAGIFSKIKNTFKAPEEIKETKMKLSELSERTVENNKSLRELEKTIEELTNRVNELSKQVGKSYVDRKINKVSYLNDITKPQNLKPVEKPEVKELPQDNPDSMESQLRKKMEERRKDLEPDYSEESDEDWGGKIKIESSDAKKPIPMSDFFKKYL